MKSEEEKPPSIAFKKLKNLISFKPKSLNEVSEVLQHALNTKIIDKPTIQKKKCCILYTTPSPRDVVPSRKPYSA